ncbi:transglutaminase-like domain-containing protein [Mucilaginibacter gotjawali]|uniref:Uncharacterized protein n=2 Tax=Mucilaginibacter gotjawali TaxID=1550579 RepID=A0A839S9Z4_9SPHI|nr:transglutaminase-like domain-containing protein [Mucilaginibacter gotjawali]MBB3054182.1 hypothetical protein [Mucilaginibacter gotjawali]BAU54453.1 Transglutaminase-like superfamily protein [Mucilaginibacter gotjawali]
MIKLLVIYFLCLFICFSAIAEPADSSATITSSKNSYEFVFNKKAGRVEVKEILSTNYTANNYTVKLPIAEVYNNNVTIENVEARIDNHAIRNLNPTYAYYSADDVFFSDEKICYFPLYLSKKGSNGNVVFTESVADPRYFTSIYFTSEFEVKQREVSIRIPRWMNAEIKEMNFGNYHIMRSKTYDSGNDEDIITYYVQNLPAMHREENSPGPTYIYPHLLVMCKSATVGGQSFKYFGSTADQYDWYRSLVKNMDNNNAAISAKAKEITAGLNNDMDKIKAVFYYVQDNIRYIAFEDGLAGFRPEKADEVLRKKYGDCKGMANLTKALLTSVGFDARLCWLGTDHIAYDYNTPSLAVDNHMICALIYKGKTIYLDATQTYLGINDYAERIQGRQVMMEDGDKFILNRVPVQSAAQNYDFETAKLSISGNDLKGSISHLWKGEDKEDVLMGVNSIKKENTDEAINRFLSNNNTDYVISNLKVSSTTNPDKDFTANYDVEVKNGVSVFSKAYYIDFDQQKELLNAAIKLNERKLDFWFPHKVNICRETELTLPANYKTSGLPETLNIVNPDYEFHIQYVPSPGKLTYKKSLLIKNTHLTVAKFAQWNKDIEQLAKTYNETITLKPVSE